MGSGFALDAIRNVQNNRALRKLHRARYNELKKLYLILLYNINIYLTNSAIYGGGLNCNIYWALAPKIRCGLKPELLKFLFHRHKCRC